MEMKYIWTALIVHFLIVWIVPKVIKEPTGIKVLDDLVLYLNSQDGFLISSSIVLALAIWGSHYWVGTMKAGQGPMTPKF